MNGFYGGGVPNKCSYLQKRFGKQWLATQEIYFSQLIQLPKISQNGTDLYIGAMQSIKWNKVLLVAFLFGCHEIFQKIY